VIPHRVGSSHVHNMYYTLTLKLAFYLQLGALELVWALVSSKYFLCLLFVKVIFSVTRNMFEFDEIQDGRHRILKI